jgi:hypothetical protein
MIAKLDDCIRGRVHVLASAIMRWCLTAANRVLIVSTRQGPQTATCHKTWHRRLCTPTTASLGRRRRTYRFRRGLLRPLSTGVGRLQ